MPCEAVHALAMAGDRDFRGLDGAAQTELRRRAVAKLRDGRTQQEAADEVGVTRQIVSQWTSRYEAEGDAALDGRKRGGGHPRTRPVLNPA